MKTLWYSEVKTILSNYMSVLSEDYPADRSMDGAQKTYRIRVEVAPEHHHLSYEKIREIYGTKSD